MKIYLAAPLFSEAEQLFNAQLARMIRAVSESIDLYVPQEQEDINDKSRYADSVMIASVDTQKVEECDLMIAVLDGLSIDAGVAAEIGIAYARKTPVIGLYSDVRTQGADVQEKLDALHRLGESQFSYVNLYVVGLIKSNGTLVGSSHELVDALESYLQASEKEK